MATGAVMVGEALENNPAMFEQNPHLQEQFGYEDPDEVAERAIELAGNTKKVGALSAANMQMFDEQFSPLVIAEKNLTVLTDTKD